LVYLSVVLWLKTKINISHRIASKRLRFSWNFKQYCYSNSLLGVPLKEFWRLVKNLMPLWQTELAVYIF